MARERVARIPRTALALFLARLTGPSAYIFTVKAINAATVFALAIIITRALGPAGCADCFLAPALPIGAFTVFHLSFDFAIFWAVAERDANVGELRKDLEARGRFCGSDHSETEVLSHLYEDHGDGFVHHLRGMYSIAVWDRRRRRLFSACKGSRMWFASTIQALRDPAISREVDRGSFRREAAEKLIRREHWEGTEEHRLRMWTLMQLEMWHREVVQVSAAPIETRP